MYNYILLACGQSCAQWLCTLHFAFMNILHIGTEQPLYILYKYVSNCWNMCFKVWVILNTPFSGLLVSIFYFKIKWCSKNNEHFIFPLPDLSSNRLQFTKVEICLYYYKYTVIVTVRLYIFWTSSTKSKTKYLNSLANKI